MALAIVQNSKGSQAAGTGVPSNVVLGGSPTVGNLIIVFLHTDSGATGVTLNTASAYGQLANVIQDSDFTTNAYVLYRYAQGGDTATLPVMATAGTCHWAYVAYEISGVTGNIGTDVAGISGNTFINSSGIFPVVVNDTPQVANSIGLFSGNNYSGAGTWTVNAGWTADYNTGSQTNFGTLVAGHNSAPTVGTPIGPTNSSSSSGVQLLIQPSKPAYAYVRQSYANNHFNVALNTAGVLNAVPIVGNLLIAFAQKTGSGLTVAAGWTQFATQASGAGSYGLYRYVQNGDTITLPAFFTDSGNAFWAYTVYELGGVSGIWLSDFEASQTASGTGSSFTTSTYTTTQPNSLVLVGWTPNQNSGFNSTAPTVSAGWSIDALQDQALIGGSSKTFASSSSSVANTVNMQSSVTGWNYIQAVFALQAISKSVAETGSATDTLSSIYTIKISVAEAGTAADTDGVAAIGLLTEFGSAIDKSSVAVKISVSINEIGNALDIVSQNYKISLAITEAGAATDRENRSMITDAFQIFQPQTGITG